MANFDFSSLFEDWLTDYDSTYTYITEDTPTITSDRTKGDPRCTTVQNFCANCQIGKEIISADLLDLTTTAPIIQKNETTGEMAPVLGATKVRPYEQYDVVTNELWEQIKRILQELHDYGLLGDREHPSQAAIDSLEKPTRQSIIYGASQDIDKYIERLGNK